MALLTRLGARSPLWQHRDYLRLWGAQGVSAFGTQITLVALPLTAILTLDASALEVAVLTGLEFLPFLLLGIPAGVWVDRLRRRPIMVLTDVARGVSLLSIPVAYWLDALALPHLYAVALVNGSLTVFFVLAYQAYLPSLVDREHLVEGNAKLEISRSGAQLAGPGLAGPIIELLTAPVALVVDAISFLSSAAFLFRIKREEQVPERKAEEKPRMRKELGEGLRYVLGHRYLRWIAASTATFNFFSNVLFAIFLVYAVRELDLSPTALGLIFALANVGYLLGAVATSRISARLGVGPTIILGAAMGAGTLLIPLAPQDSPIPYLIAAEALVAFGLPVYNVTQVSFRQAITPERLQGRMNSVMRFIVWGVIPIGSLVGGAVASAVDLRAAIWLGAIGMSLAFLPVLVSPVRTLRHFPEPADAGPVEDEALPIQGVTPPPVDDRV
jgi:MFS family permease